MATAVIKRDASRASEYFSETKLHNSIAAACMSVRSLEGEAETAAKKVVQAVAVWLVDRPEVTSDDVRRVAAHHLSRIHPEAAYMYKNHLAVL